MLIDTSAFLAILLREPEADAIEAAIIGSASRHMAAPGVVEAYAAMQWRKGSAGGLAVDALLQQLEIEVVPMSADAVGPARDAYRRFGKGTGSAANLNFGDCLSYGIARALDEPLLFKGEDFTRTDVAVAEY